MATRITIDRKLPIKASANPQKFSCRREILSFGTHPWKVSLLQFVVSFSSDFVEFFSSFSSVVVGTSSSSSSHKSSSSFYQTSTVSHRGVGFPKKVFVNHSSSFKENLQYSGRFLQHIVSIFLRRIKWSSYSPKGNYYTLPKFVEISECSNCDVASFYLEYQWFQSGLNYK